MKCDNSNGSGDATLKRGRVVRKHRYSWSLAMADSNTKSTWCKVTTPRTLERGQDDEQGQSSFKKMKQFLSDPDQISETEPF